MFLKVFIIIMVVAMIASLGAAGYFLINDRGESGGRTVWALTIRVGIWVLLFAFLMIGVWLGWFEEPPRPPFHR